MKKTNQEVQWGLFNCHSILNFVEARKNKSYSLEFKNTGVDWNVSRSWNPGKESAYTSRDPHFCDANKHKKYNSFKISGAERRNEKRR